MKQILSAQPKCCLATVLCVASKLSNCERRAVGRYRNPVRRTASRTMRTPRGNMLNTTPLERLRRHIWARRDFYCVYSCVYTYVCDCEWLQMYIYINTCAHTRIILCQYVVSDCASAIAFTHTHTHKRMYTNMPMYVHTSCCIHKSVYTIQQ